MQWGIIPRDEQETVVKIDYSEKTVTIYTTRKAVAKRLVNKIGAPDKVDIYDNQINGITYKRDLFDKDVKKFFSKTLLIGSFRRKK